MGTPILVTVLGSRGSIPVSGAAYTRYGGATCCILVQTQDETLILDAGTGIIDLPHHLVGKREAVLLLSHPHVDHIIGLPMLTALFRPDFRLDIYGAAREGMEIGAQIHKLISPPLWPIEPAQFAADVRFLSLPPQMDVGRMHIESMEGSHPGGVSVLRVTLHDKRIVLLTDCTITEKNRAALLAFCQGCDLLLCDGQYSEDEWTTRSSFGHNTWSMAAHFARDCGAKRARILHHDPGHSDSVLDAARNEVLAIFPACDLTFDGEELIL